ncbi:MAG: hypothetical protein ABSD90_16660, partial [Methylocystis sp.]
GTKSVESNSRLSASPLIAAQTKAKPAATDRIKGRGCERLRCRIAIFNKLAEIMLASNKDDSSPLLPWLVPAKISSTSVANSDQFCIKIKAVISSAWKNFLGDIIKSNLGK